MDFKELRKLSGMTQKAFAEYFNIPQRTVENWDGGQRQCPDYILDLMLYKLNKENIISMVGKRVFIIDTDSIYDGEWGIVADFDDELFHVRIANGKDMPVFDRTQIKFQ